MQFPRLRRVAIAAGSGLLSTSLRLYAKTLRLENGELAPLRSALADGPVIYAFFHNKIILMPFSLPSGEPYRPVHVLISPSDDGTLVARSVAPLGVVGVRGSSSRHGHPAREQLIEELRSGHNVGITPDGPRGPALEVKAGVVWLASMSAAPIIGISWGASACRRLKSWDRFVLPTPGARIRYGIGKPLYLDPAMTFARRKTQVRDYLLALTRSVDPLDPMLPENHT